LKPQPVARIENIMFSTTDNPFHKAIPNNPQGRPNIFVWRKNAHQTIKLVGYVGMPLFIGDLISTLPNIGLVIEFYLGGRANIGAENLVQIESEKDIRVIKGDSPFSIFDMPKSATKIRTAGGVTAGRG
jgi:hypothetical protein